MLHNPGNQNILTVANRIHFDFLAWDIFIYQNGVILCDLVDDPNKFVNILVRDGNLHTLAAQHIGRSY